jgi:hypothetical protein
MATKVEKALTITKALIALEEEIVLAQEKIASLRKQLTKLMGDKSSKRSPKKADHKPPMVPPDQTSDVDPSLGDYGSRGGYGQRGKTGEILAYMRTIPDQMMAPEDVVRELKWPGDKETNCQIASRLLQRLAQARKLDRPHRGLYQFNSSNKG